jgi:hypothetical protein
VADAFTSALVEYWAHAWGAPTANARTETERGTLEKVIVRIFIPPTCPMPIPSSKDCDKSRRWHGRVSQRSCGPPHEPLEKTGRESLVALIRERVGNNPWISSAGWLDRIHEH